MPRSPHPAGQRSTSRDRRGSAPRPRQHLRHWLPLAVFLAAAGTAYALDLVPWWLLAIYGVMSTVTFLAYASDKRSARAGRRRIPESTLLNLGSLCGWPGAVAAQQILRHKTIKESFRRSFWQHVLVNVATVTLLFSPLAGLAVDNILQVTDVIGQ